MRYPDFIAEMARPENRPKIWTSTYTGFATVAFFAALTAVGHHYQLIAAPRLLLALVLFKVLTNAASWLALRRDRLVLEAGSLNVAADLLCMTGAIYCTGDAASPLFSMYLIEITVVALLTNLGLTLLITTAAIALYGALLLLVHQGLLPHQPPPTDLPGAWSAAHRSLTFGYGVMMLGLPTLYTVRILDALREKSRALEATNAQLIEASQQKNRFMANITHELRTPIHGICGLSDLVTAGIYGPISDKQRRAHDDIKRSAGSLLQLVDGLLELARDDAHRFELNASAIDLPELLTSAARSARWMLGTKRLDLTVELDPSVAIFPTDRPRLTHIVLNLLSNAIKFTPEGGRIWLRARHDGAALVVEVTDTGIGIADEEKALIFEEFRQADGSMERRYGGVGLGLALIKRLTLILGGEVSVDSTPDHGSTFRVKLPPLPLPSPAPSHAPLA